MVGTVEHQKQKTKQKYPLYLELSFILEVDLDHKIISPGSFVLLVLLVVQLLDLRT